MYKLFISLFFTAGLSVTHAQSDVDEILFSIAKNNKAIASSKQYVEAKSLEFKTGNTLDNPSLSADYLIGKPVAGGNQFDFQAIQAFDFPTAYKYRGDLADTKIELLNIEFFELKQAVLFEAKTLILEVIYLKQYENVLKNRLETSEAIVNNYQEKYDAELISALELNKAKIQKLSINGELRSIKSLMTIANEKLAELNGGKDLEIAESAYPELQKVPVFEVLNDSIESNDPRLKWYSQQSEVFKTQVKLSKSLALPTFETGYHYQTVLGQTFNGIHFGMSIPLWQQKNTVKSSQAYVEMNNFQIDEHKTEHYYYIKELYAQCANTLSIILEYKEVLNALNSEEILLQSLELGEIDFIVYATEIEYYYDAKDELMLFEKEYQMIIAELFKYQL